MKVIPTQRISTSHRATARKTSTRGKSLHKTTIEDATEGTSAGFSSPSPAVAALDQTSCSRFDLNALLKQLAFDFHETVPMRVDLHSGPMPVFANVGHLSTALQELLKFLAASVKNGEVISLESTPSSAKEILKKSGGAGQLLFPQSNWNAMHSGQRAFAVIKMLKAGAMLPETSVARFLKAARNVGASKNDEAGIQRLGRVFRKHRINLLITSTESAGTIFQLFILLADVGK